MWHMLEEVTGEKEDQKKKLYGDVLYGTRSSAVRLTFCFMRKLNFDQGIFFLGVISLLNFFLKGGRDPGEKRR